MIRKLAKVLIRALLLFAGLFVLLGAIWLTVNLWPQALEPELWSETILLIPEEPLQNGWNALPDDGKDVEDFFDDMPDTLNNLAYMHGVEPNTDEVEISVSAYWAQAETLQAKLNSYLEQRNKELKLYQTLLGYPQFIDNTQPIIGAPQKAIFYYRSLHTLGLLHVIQKMLNNEPQLAYDFFQKIFAQDLSLAYSAQSLIHCMLSLSLIHQDLQFLSLLQQKHAPENWAELSRIIRDIRWEALDFRRNLIFEYRQTLSAHDLIMTEKSQARKIFRALFNRAATRKLAQVAQLRG